MSTDDAQPTSPAPQRSASPRRDKVIQPLSNDLSPVSFAQAAPAGIYAQPAPSTPASASTLAPALSPGTGTGAVTNTTAETPAQDQSSENPAVDLIRHKLDQIFANEPPAEKEEAEVQTIPHRSKHQEFMYQLSNSGKSQEAIQTEWHAYYSGLSEAEKHAVWQEFYAAQQQAQLAPQVQPAQQSAEHHHPASHRAPAQQPQTQPQPQSEQPATRTTATKRAAKTAKPTVTELKAKLLGTVKSRSKLKRRQHLQSIFFGLGLGTLTVLIMLFSFFNERFIAPFMTPSRAISSTPIIIDPGSTAAGQDPKIIIPKINVEVPVIYDIDTIDEKVVQEGLERGTVHYVNTADPGQLGNGVIFGHSSSNILNSGKYKFAFVLLRKLEKDDIFYLEKDGKRYGYRIYDKKIVPPSDVSVLYRNDKPATITLITCDPPGSNINRLVIVGEQVSPNPINNAAGPAEKAQEPTQLPSNSPSLWSRIWGS